MGYTRDADGFAVPLDDSHERPRTTGITENQSYLAGEGGGWRNHNTKPVAYVGVIDSNHCHYDHFASNVPYIVTKLLYK